MIDQAKDVIPEMEWKTVHGTRSLIAEKLFRDRSVRAVSRLTDHQESGFLGGSGLDDRKW